MVRKKLELSTHVYWQLATMKCKYDGGVVTILLFCDVMEEMAQHP